MGGAGPLRPNELIGGDIQVCAGRNDRDLPVSLLGDFTQDFFGDDSGATIAEWIEKYICDQKMHGLLSLQP